MIEHYKALTTILIGLLVILVTPFIIRRWVWVRVRRLFSSILIYFSLITSMFSRTVLFVTLTVLIFSFWYITFDTKPWVFILITISFVRSMIILLCSKDWFLIITAWEGLGVTRFYLVRFYSSWNSHEGAIITILTNRIGDITLIGAAIYLLAANLNLSNAPLFIIFLIRLTIIRKRAQYPIIAWLPAAIAAPTPISSLVHSSTLVTAGIILWLKLSLVPISLILVTRIGIITLIRGRWAAITEIDFKRIVAFSTLRQLGLIVVRISLINPTFRWFHLITHAFFKRSLFIWVGCLIFYRSSNQTTSLFGSSSVINITWIAWSIITLLSLRAIPLTPGFFSKERFSSILISRVFVFCLSLTVIYSYRLFKVTNSISVKTSAKTTWSNIPALSIITLTSSGLIWTRNFSHTAPLRLIWCVGIILIPVWAWINKKALSSFYKISELTKIFSNLSTLSDSWFYLWNWTSSSSKVIVTLSRLIVLIAI